MFCENCGAEYGNQDKFCHSCGKPFNQNNGGNQESVVLEQGNAGSREKGAGAAKLKAGMNQLVQKAKVLPKKVVIGAAAAIVALIVIICVVVNAKKTINLNDYLTFETSGYDGYGTVRATIDWDKIEKKYGNKVSYTSEAKKHFGGLIRIAKPVEVIEECVRVDLDNKYGLSNGDKVTYTWDIDEDLSKAVKCKLKYKDSTYSVSGLEKVNKFDAFADLNVSFSGISPKGSVNMEYTGSELSRYDFDCESYDGLSNGDTVKITIDCNMESFINKYGKAPEVLEKEYKVEGLNSYVTKTAEINDQGLEAMKQQASDVFHSDVARNWDECVTLESFTYVGNYLLTTKNPNSWGTQNTLYLVYNVQSKTDYTYGEESFKDTTDYFWYIKYSDLTIDANGELIVDVTDYGTCSNRFTVDSGINNGWWSTTYWNYNGYESLDALYNDAVTSYMDSYNHEDNIDDSLAAVTE